MPSNFSSTPSNAINKDNDEDGDGSEEQSKTQQMRTKLNRTEQNETEQNRKEEIITKKNTEQNRTEQNRTEYYVFLKRRDLSQRLLDLSKND